jgi:perosamine synthetase
MIAQRILEVLKAVIGDTDGIALHEPYFGGNEWAYTRECLDTGWVSLGKFVDKFETMLVEFTGAKRAVAVVNGTAALHLSLLLAGVSPGDEVIVPALTFVGTANAVSHCGAVPHFVDSEERTLGLDPYKLADYLRQITRRSHGSCLNKATGRPIRAVVPMHTFGHPVDLEPLVEVCRRFGLELVEDAAESLGSYYKGRHVGNWGKLAILSFNGNKTITTGGGGAILTNDEELGKLAKHISSTAKVSHQWQFFHDRVGYNYRLPNINAALGCAQLEQLPVFLEKKRILAQRYRQSFSGLEGVQFFTEPEFARSNYWLNVLLVGANQAKDSGAGSLPRRDLVEIRQIRDAVLDLTNANGIMTRPVWTLLPNLPMYKDFPKMELSVAEEIEHRLINIPSSPVLANLPGPSEKTALTKATPRKHAPVFIMVSE